LYPEITCPEDIDGVDVFTFSVSVLLQMLSTLEPMMKDFQKKSNLKLL